MFKENRIAFMWVGLVLALSVLAFASAQDFGEEVVENDPVAEVTMEQLLRELQFTQTTLFMATNDAALKLWYEEKLDSIIKRYVPEDQHPDIGREIIALQGEAHELHQGLLMVLHSALIEAQIRDPDMMLGAAAMNFRELYQESGELIKVLHGMMGDLEVEAQ